jgi:hypothetical protein
MAACQWCPANSVSGGGGHVCQVCAANAVSNDARSSCVPCPQGQHREATMAACQSCPRGFFCSHQNVTACQAGHYCPPGSSFPTPCAKGSSCPTPREQLPCLSGRYCPSGTTEPLRCPAGATCTVPASPELILAPDLFDVIESEVVDVHNGVLQYMVSLSAQPTRNVTVTVNTTNVRSAACYQYGPKFQLTQRELLFHPGNYHAPQAVTIVVDRLNASRYEGTFAASFQHSIKTDDEDFAAAFLRPVSVTLQDDSECVRDAQKFEDKSTRIRACGCVDGFFILGTDPRFCGSVIQCGKCPDGMECHSASNPFGQILEEALVDSKWYRRGNSSVNVVKCPEPSTQCVGRATHGDRLCRQGHHGPFCMVCVLGAEERYVRSGDACVKCDGSSLATLYVALVLLGLFCVVVVAFLMHKKKRRANQRDGQKPSLFHSDRLAAFADKLQIKYKVCVPHGLCVLSGLELYVVGRVGEWRGSAGGCCCCSFIWDVLRLLFLFLRCDVVGNNIFIQRPRFVCCVGVWTDSGDLHADPVKSRYHLPSAAAVRVHLVLGKL